MEPLRSALLAGIALCGLAIAIFSFLTWVSFEAQTPGFAVQQVNVETSGPDTSVWRDEESIDVHSTAPRGIGWCSCEVGFGDGYFTAALGVALVIAAAAAALTVFSGWGLITSLVAALATVVIAGFNAFADWSALVSVTNTGTTVVADGEVQFALYAIVAAAALSAVLSVVSWAMERADTDVGEYDDENESDEEPATGGDSWVSV